MKQEEFRMPKMGESITEATIISWAKSIGDWIEEDEVLLEIATDKVDTELPSPYAGKIVSLLYEEGTVVGVGELIAVIEVENEEAQIEDLSLKQPNQAEPVKSLERVKPVIPKDSSDKPKEQAKISTAQIEDRNIEVSARPSNTQRFYSPLVRSIAAMEQLSITELDSIVGTGAEGRVTKADVVGFALHRAKKTDKNQINYEATPASTRNKSYSGDVKVIEMDRMRRMIADHMVRSKQTSPHVTSFLEVDVTEIVNWRSRIKEDYLAQYNEKITFTPIFIEAVARAIKDFPGINASVDGHRIIIKKYINIGMATATAKGNLIVPVIRNVDQMDLHQIVRSVNDLASRARNGKLIPDEVQDGTFTLTNVGTFGNTLGTPIINQPQVAILSTGAIKKKPAVIETASGDQILIRQFMFLSLSYDHRIVDGALGGQFLRRVGDYLESFSR